MLRLPPPRFGGCPPDQMLNSTLCIQRAWAQTHRSRRAVQENLKGATPAACSCENNLRLILCLYVNGTGPRLAKKILPRQIFRSKSIFSCWSEPPETRRARQKSQGTQEFHHPRPDTPPHPAPPRFEGHTMWPVHLAPSPRDIPTDFFCFPISSCQY